MLPPLSPPPVVIDTVPIPTGENVEPPVMASVTPAFTTRAGDGHGSDGDHVTISRDGHLQDEHPRPSQTQPSRPRRTVICQAGNQKESAGTATRRSPRTPHQDAPNAIGGAFHAFIYDHANPTRNSRELHPNQLNPLTQEYPAILAIKGTDLWAASAFKVFDSWSQLRTELL
jgi:hypothetical protein